LPILLDQFGEGRVKFHFVAQRVLSHIGNPTNSRPRMSRDWVVRSTDGRATWSRPVAVSQLVDIIPLANTAFRNNSYPSAAVAPDGIVYVT
jgi:hypothetical protein